MALRSPIAARSLSSSWGHMQFLASFPIAFTLAILASGLVASLIKERCAHDLSHCMVSADGVMYAALFMMLLGLATWNVHVLGRGCLVAIACLPLSPQCGPEPFFEEKGEGFELNSKKSDACALTHTI